MPQVVDAVDVPVVATGGIMDGRGLAAALALGAQAVQMGTRFLVTAEAGVPEAYQERIARSRDTDTFITRAVSGRPARGLVNRLVAELEALGAPGLGFPRQGGASADLRAAAAAATAPSTSPCGPARPAAWRRALPAEHLVAQIVQEARLVIAGLAVVADHVFRRLIGKPRGRGGGGCLGHASGRPPPLGVGGEHPRVGPFAQQGAVEALDLAVGARGSAGGPGGARPGRQRRR